MPIEDIPLMPPAPVLEKPEYPIPAEPEKPNTPPTTPENKPKVTPKPLTPPAPKQVVIRKYEEKKPVVNNIPPKVIEAAKKVETHSLPNTGSSLELALVTTGVFLATVGIAISRKETK